MQTRRIQSIQPFKRFNYYLLAKRARQSTPFTLLPDVAHCAFDHRQITQLTFQPNGNTAVNKNKFRFTYAHLLQKFIKIYHESHERRKYSLTLTAFRPGEVKWVRMRPSCTERAQQVEKKDIWNLGTRSFRQRTSFFFYSVVDFSSFLCRHLKQSRDALNVMIYSSPIFLLRVDVDVDALLPLQRARSEKTALKKRK